MHDTLGDQSRAFLDSFNTTFANGTTGITVLMQDGFFGNFTFFDNRFFKTNVGVRILGTQQAKGTLDGYFLNGSNMRDVGTAIHVDAFYCSPWLGAVPKFYWWWRFDGISRFFGHEWDCYK